MSNIIIQKDHTKVLSNEFQKGNTCRKSGRIKTKPILVGLNYNYYRKAA